MITKNVVILAVKASYNEDKIRKLLLMPKKTNTLLNTVFIVFNTLALLSLGSYGITKEQIFLR
jgi:hypothetical protein